MKIQLSRQLMALMLLTCFVMWIFVVPLSLYFQLESESTLATSSINLAEKPEVLEIKIAFGLPYNADWSTPKESNGLMEIKGEFYTLISTDYRNDTLYYRYLKNNKARKVFGVLSDYVAQNDHNNTQKNNSANFRLSKWMDFKYLQTYSPIIEKEDLRLLIQLPPNYTYHNLYDFHFYNVVIPPPKSA